MHYEKMVTVIVPTYGRPRTLARAVDSVLSQTFKDIEVIVVDDNNPDTESRSMTENVMEKYLCDKNVTYLQHKHNKNGAAARNTGLSVSRGKYITFLDDDDEMLPDRIMLMFTKMESLDKSWCACYSGFEKRKSNGVSEKCGEKRTGNLYLEAMMRSLYFCPGSNLFARSENVKAIGGFDEDFARNQDLEFLARLLETGKLARIEEETLIIHYEEKVSTGQSKEVNYQKKICYDEFYIKKFKDRIKKLSKSEQKKIYQYVALERFRSALKAGKIREGFDYCSKNGVTFFLFNKYIIYMAYRFATKRSVGFKM